MKHIIIGTALSLSMATQGFALSCVAPDVAAAFQQASASDKTYVVLKGTYDFTPPAGAETLKPQSVDAAFSGRLLTGKGFTEQVAANVTINLTCAGEWCAELTPGTEYVTFVENNNGTLVLEVSPCYALTFPEPPIEQIKRIENCARGGSCEVAQQ